MFCFGVTSSPLGFCPCLDMAAARMSKKGLSEVVLLTNVDQNEILHFLKFQKMLV